ncbi:MAG: PAS domain S-box protein [Puia sp.]|nr:PAS domain S-box protein [Puia sp.]
MNEYRGTSFMIFIVALLLSLLAGSISWMLSFFILLAAILLKSGYDYKRSRLPEKEWIEPITDYRKTEEKLLKVNRLYSFMSALNQMIIRTRDEESLFKEVCQIAIDVGKFRMAWVGIKHPEQNEIAPLVFSGFETGYLSQIKIVCKPDDPNGNGPTGTAIKTGRCVVCNDISIDPGMNIWKKEAAERGYCSSISLPICKGGEIAAALTLYAPITDFFDETEVQLLLQAAADVSFALDVLERDRQRIAAEDEVLRSEKRFRALIENSTDGLTVLSQDGVVLEMGPSGKRILGYDAEAIVGKVRVDLIHPDDVTRVHSAFLEVINFPRQIKTIEYRHVMPNGDFKWLECSFNNLLDKPYLNAIVLNYRDISGRKQAESKMQESEGKYRKAEAIGKMGHWERDLVSDKLYWSDEIYRIFGLSKNELDNRYEMFLSTVHPDDRRAFEKAQEELVAGTKSMDIVHRIITGAGATKYVHEIAEAIASDSGEIIRLSGTVQDITLLARARDEILVEKQLSDSIINSLPGAFYLYTREGRFLRWNNNFEQVTGYTAAEIRAMHPLDFFDGGEKEMMAEKIDEVFRQGHSTAEAQFHLKNRNKIPYYFTGRAIEYDGRPCLLGVGIDISERVSAQEKMKETSEQLRKLAAHLQDIREEERVSMAREIHDELGQQLTGLKMDIYWLKDELVPKDEKTEAQMTAILKLTDQAINSVRRIASALRPSILDDLGLEEAMKAHCREFQARFGLAVSCRIDLAGIQLPGKTAIGLFRIFQESLTNIARHAEASKVYVSLRVVKGNLELLVRDNGKGFDITATSGKRTLGLLGMRERVYMLDGNYRVHSVPGAGTEIHVGISLSKIRTNS